MSLGEQEISWDLPPVHIGGSADGDCDFYSVDDIWHSERRSGAPGKGINGITLGSDCDAIHGDAGDIDDSAGLGHCDHAPCWSKPPAIVDALP